MHNFIIETGSGRSIDLFTPSNNRNHFWIGDISGALSKLCRFNGHCHPFYSVAQHSVHVAELVPQHYKLMALLHDATEAYLGDMVTPLKALFPDFKKLEKSFLIEILNEYNIPPNFDIIDIKWADMIMLATEKRDLMINSVGEWDILKGVQPLPDKIRPWSSAEAEHKFLNMFFEVSKTVG